MVCGVLFVYLLFTVFSCVFDYALTGGCLFMFGVWLCCDFVCFCGLVVVLVFNSVVICLFFDILVFVIVIVGDYLRVVVLSRVCCLVVAYWFGVGSYCFGFVFGFWCLVCFWGWCLNCGLRCYDLLVGFGCDCARCWWVLDG